MSHSLTKEHIAYIIKDLHHRGLVLEGLHDELIDHVCTGVEAEMATGKRFMQAYHQVIKSFGSTAGLQDTQAQTLKSENQRRSIMLRNYFMIAVRNLKKHRFYALINMAGLAVGVASCLIIMLYVSDELSYDRHFADADRIYRVNCEIKFGANHLRLAVTPAPLSEILRKDFPEVEVATRFWNGGSSLVKRFDQNIKENGTVFADSSIFRVFSIPFLEGSPDQALVDPRTMVISRKVAEKYFPNESPLGQSLILDNGDAFKITGVYENMPSTGHFHFDFIMALVTVDYHKDQNWLSNNFNTYIKLRRGSDPGALEAKFPAMVDRYAGPWAKLALGGDFTMEKFRSSGNKLEHTLMPLTDIHLHSDLTAELGVNSNVTYVYLFSGIALFILLIACINFMNLSTARSANRAKEVGIRKVMGSLRSHLVRQFLLESILLSVFSFILALGIAYLIVPTFNELARKELSIPFGSPSFWGILFGAALLVGAFSGLYPSFFLSAFKPVNILKGNLALGMKSGLVRSTLVVFQFSISIILVVGTIAINRQLSFIQNKRIGFNKDQVIVIHDAYAVGNQLEAFKQEVLKTSKVTNGTISGFLPVNGTNRSDNTHWPYGTQPTEGNMVALQCWRVDYEYVSTLGMRMKEGRDFSPDHPSDSGAVILNEAAAAMFGFSDDPVGQKISTFRDWGDLGFDPKHTEDSEVIGVLEDFHFESLRQNIAPLALFLGPSRGLVSFRFGAGDTREVISGIETIWKRVAPGMPFEYSFLDEDFGRMYAAEQRLGKIFVVFAALAIVIACLGLFALTAFTAEQRTREIGIRKVLGASVSGIVLLLSQEFGKLIIIAFLLAAPLAWWGVNWWMEGYMYKAEIGIAVYFLSGISAFVIAWLTMSYQSIKAATSDPVKSLRSE